MCKCGWMWVYVWMILCVAVHVSMGIRGLCGRVSDGVVWVYRCLRGMCGGSVNIELEI